MEPEVEEVSVSTAEEVSLPTEEAAAPRGGKRLKEKKRTWKQELVSWLCWIGIPVLVVLFLNQFVGSVAYVSGTSMYPTLYDRDLLLVQSIFYTPQQGDIVICNVTVSSSLQGKFVVKRVIAVGGQTVVIDYDNNTVTVDGEVLQEDYLNTSYGDVMIGSVNQVDTYEVPEGYIFVMGDNRNNSADSRSSFVGMIPLEEVEGGVVFRLPIGVLIGDNDSP